MVRGYEKSEKKDMDVEVVEAASVQSTQDHQSSVHEIETESNIF